jgi:hypothetical protein
MKKYLSHYWHSGGVKEFDTVSGSVVNAINIKPEETGFGSLWKQNGKWFAFYSDEESFIFQHKHNIWRVTPEYSVSIRAYFLLRYFKIMLIGSVVFSILYKPKFLFIALLDSTHDSIDEESDDFFLYVKNMWQRWANSPLAEFNESRKKYKEKKK